MAIAVTYLVVAGGGGGSSSNGGGGGAGGYLTGSTNVDTGTSYTINVGIGGAKHINGTNSTFAAISTIGGGRGGNESSETGAAGGSGGGGAFLWSSTNLIAGGAGTSGQGYAGGSGTSGGTGLFNGGGGGGASGSPTTAMRHSGGPGVANSLWTSGSRYAGGGGGVWSSGYPSPTVDSGGGWGDYYSSVSPVTNGSVGSPGTRSTGGGGGGGYYGSVSATSNGGGSGIIVISYPKTYPQATITGYTLNSTYFYKVSTNGLNHLYQFVTPSETLSSTGTITFAPPNPPSLITLPSLSGNLSIGITGSILTASTGSWSDNPTSYSYQWVRSSTDISGFTSNTYTLTTGDIGNNISCRVTAINLTGSSIPAVSSSIFIESPVYLISNSFLIGKVQNITKFSDSKVPIMISSGSFISEKVQNFITPIKLLVLNSGSFITEKVQSIIKPFGGGTTTTTTTVTTAAQKEMWI
ncbi:hypothetical protein UFOVP961_137 [uncultured Caudovirales phage]|uniref:Glycine-rich domain-containing protein n=1 Tax=uncultured Caudovirales phage TaxID=2100421 RepID=A0A6J5R131_9CAUD|nr:hypothetical protein UFOVP961_137 [uncultured Caudovirales phage]CAB4185404.1 hypothetical protein UFOVP1123_65 [uncultured Caudovirales phage]CAB4193462.1 hypothetical protein UFOVP1239_85 [uncultured Caudovirales phage]CAB4216060.1 hypothetical protein UFOVP1484_69 [uncultured Caudovirales phage]CAB5230721.1 hypothetical protein UFOVP1577_75 [uncultured Caudovirales phage]